jgi:hypothetical protein
MRRAAAAAPSLVHENITGGTGGADRVFAERIELGRRFRDE